MYVWLLALYIKDPIRQLERERKRERGVGSLVS